MQNITPLNCVPLFCQYEKKKLKKEIRFAGCPQNNDLSIYSVHQVK